MLIENYSKNAWKDKIKIIIKETAFQHLQEQVKGRNMSKIINNKYSELMLQEYFNSDEINKNTKLFIFKLRTRMVQVGSNFGKVEACPVCLEGNNDQSHLLQCTSLNSSSGLIRNECSKYVDIYEEDSTKVTDISMILH